jgi:hypothetical protein
VPLVGAICQVDLVVPVDVKAVYQGGTGRVGVALGCALPGFVVRVEGRLETKEATSASRRQIQATRIS